MPAAFEGGQFVPEHLNIPDEMIYSYMMHRISKQYAISKFEAGMYCEVDFWEMLMFENLDNKKEEYLSNQKD